MSLHRRIAEGLILGVLLLTVIPSAHRFFTRPSHRKPPPSPPIRYIVTFGDSYTDVHATVNRTAWPVYAASYGHFALHSFAQAGASCDARLTPRADLGAFRFPYVVQDELPAYFAAIKGGLRLPAEETLYSLWIGTNDVGAGALLTGEQTRGATIVEVTRCAVGWVRTLYASGARNFLLQNVRPSVSGFLRAC